MNQPPSQAPDSSVSLNDAELQIAWELGTARCRVRFEGVVAIFLARSGPSARAFTALEALENQGRRLLRGAENLQQLHGQVDSLRRQLPRQIRPLTGVLLPATESDTELRHDVACGLLWRERAPASIRAAISELRDSCARFAADVDTLSLRLTQAFPPVLADLYQRSVEIHRSAWLDDVSAIIAVLGDDLRARLPEPILRMTESGQPLIGDPSPQPAPDARGWPEWESFWPEDYPTEHRPNRGSRTASEVESEIAECLTRHHVREAARIAAKLIRHDPHLPTSANEDVSIREPPQQMDADPGGRDPAADATAREPRQASSGTPRRSDTNRWVSPLSANNPYDLTSNVADRRKLRQVEVYRSPGTNGKTRISAVQYLILWKLVAAGPGGVFLDDLGQKTDPGDDAPASADADVASRGRKSVQSEISRLNKKLKSLGLVAKSKRGESKYVLQELDRR